MDMTQHVKLGLGITDIRTVAWEDAWLLGDFSLACRCICLSESARICWPIHVWRPKWGDHSTLTPQIITRESRLLSLFIE